MAIFVMCVFLMKMHHKITALEAKASKPITVVTHAELDTLAAKLMQYEEENANLREDVKNFDGVNWVLKEILKKEKKENRAMEKKIKEKEELDRDNMEVLMAWKQTADVEKANNTEKLKTLESEIEKRSENMVAWRKVFASKCGVQFAILAIVASRLQGRINDLDQSASKGKADIKDIQEGYVKTLEPDSKRELRSLRTAQNTTARRHKQTQNELSKLHREFNLWKKEGWNHFVQLESSHIAVVNLAHDAGTNIKTLQQAVDTLQSSSRAASHVQLKAVNDLIQALTTTYSQVANNNMNIRVQSQLSTATNLEGVLVASVQTLIDMITALDHRTSTSEGDSSTTPISLPGSGWSGQLNRSTSAVAGSGSNINTTLQQGSLLSRDGLRSSFDLPNTNINGTEHLSSAFNTEMTSSVGVDFLPMQPTFSMDATDASNGPYFSTPTTLPTFDPSTFGDFSFSPAPVAPSISSRKTTAFTRATRSHRKR